MSFMAKSAGQNLRERVQGVLDDHLWHDSRSLNVSGIWSNTSQDTDRCF